jgi:hypothetical protein
MKRIKNKLSIEDIEKWLNRPSVHLSQDTGLKIPTGRNYIKLLLLTLWEEKESFSGKRPFGNSGWDYYIAASLIEIFPNLGKLNEDGYVDEVDDDLVNDYVAQIIEYIFKEHEGEGCSNS